MFLTWEDSRDFLCGHQIDVKFRPGADFKILVQKHDPVIDRYFALAVMDRIGGIGMYEGTGCRQYRSLIRREPVHRYGRGKHVWKRGKTGCNAEARPEYAAEQKHRNQALHSSLLDFQSRHRHTLR